MWVSLEKVLILLSFKKKNLYLNNWIESVHPKFVDVSIEQLGTSKFEMSNHQIIRKKYRLKLEEMSNGKLKAAPQTSSCEVRE